MRLFYFIFFLSLFGYGATASSRGNDHYLTNKANNASLITKKSFKLNANAEAQNESFEKDIISSIQQKISPSFLLPFGTSVAYLHQHTYIDKITRSSTVCSYCNLFKLLYPEHFFW